MWQPSSWELLCHLLARSVSHPIQLAGETADRVASLDLREDIQGHDRDEAGRLLGSLASMQEALRALVGKVSLSIENINSASATYPAAL